MQGLIRGLWDQDLSQKQALMTEPPRCPTPDPLLVDLHFLTREKQREMGYMPSFALSWEAGDPVPSAPGSYPALQKILLGA